MSLKVVYFNLVVQLFHNVFYTIYIDILELRYQLLPVFFFIYLIATGAVILCSVRHSPQLIYLGFVMIIARDCFDILIISYEDDILVASRTRS